MSCHCMHAGWTDGWAPQVRAGHAERAGGRAPGLLPRTRAQTAKRAWQVTGATDELVVVALAVASRRS